MLEYRLAPAHPEAREYALELVLPSPDPCGQVVSMAAWTPGSYMVRDHARHLTHIEACDAQGREVAITWVDKQTWRLAPCTGPLTLRWRVHAFELSVRTAYLDTLWGFADGAALWLRPHGQEHQPCRLNVLRGESVWTRHWQASTTLAPEHVDADGYGSYLASDFAALLDAPVAFGPLCVLTFDVRGVPHRFVWLGRVSFDEARVATDLARVCNTVVELFGTEPPPFSRYTFLALVTADGYGGLEHGEGSALLCRREHFPLPGAGAPTPAYREFLGLCAHEYLHAWLVKRIRPAALQGLPLAAEAYTRLLWLFEGVTSYYDDLLLARAGLIGAKEYLEGLAATLSRVRSAPGRLRQSLEQASLTAWTRLYKADENSANVGISYYTKGAVFAWVLDAELRRRSADRVSLDDALRALWCSYGLSGRAIGEDELEGWLQAELGVELGDLFESGLRGTDELPLLEAAATFGLRLTWEAEHERPWLGAKVHAGTRGEAVLGTVYAKAAAERAGLAPRDVLVAIDGLRVDAANLEGLLERLRVGQQVHVHAFRRDELLKTQLCLDPAPLTRAILAFDPQAEAQATRRRGQWLALA